MEEIIRLQNNLLLIRRAVGWTAIEFGEKIGVTRQTINNLENGRNKLNKTQYLAMRSVLDTEISNSPEETEMLKVLLEVLVDNPDNYSEDLRKELLEKANIMAPGILAGSSNRKTVSKEWLKLAVFAIGGIGVGATFLASPTLALGVASAGSWIKKLANEKAKIKAENQALSDEAEEEENFKKTDRESAEDDATN